MNKPLFANERIMKQYLTALLTEDEALIKAALQPVEKLLEQVVEPEKKVLTKKRVEPTEIKVSTKQDDEKQPTISSVEDEILELQKTLPKTKYEAEYRKGEFQALFFQVAGLTLAVPLKSLGGIHKIGEINKVFAKPSWFKGVMLNRGTKLNIIDTAQWVMPEKYNKKLEESLNYKYLIMLGETNWGLQAESLVNNITLQNDDVKWREQTGKRPWLAGLIKEKMCALIDVDSLTELLDQGLDSREIEK
ncbi:chemotaxis protein CheW [Pseudoalteromonas denitrificans]|uniref:Purine-binding chemotaxis protein CheW n=1 Tax=Pseudoalteromonas denitrificans DSM 6059 TaxID=1123010 RepID=A0A1I1HG16_9GAMM|nr:chemotaxis protein CheW [Pseudoalteromonas denitrificans]SFC22957.1 purine-binding chemotaxis protein CheW [Pseudoalteromonas denitrificans DSM 6059]